MPDVQALVNDFLIKLKKPTAGGARRNGTHQWRTGLTCGLLVDALSYPGHECRASSLRNQTNLRLLIVVVDDFEIAKRTTLLFSRENDFFELDDWNNLRPI
ncbi:hypothetical protein DKX38_022981 [Salix brachista]|uniref:Uncharacterized protein n=1 Tax=Salix brachista TaxID=2182728 RepID=A0A5N5K1M8_9ROSI|nr:hypothetical protein DKX38_022981 [Salix brachista]